MRSSSVNCMNNLNIPCGRRHCSCNATNKPTLVVPTKEDGYDNILIGVDLLLCDICASKVSVGEFLNKRCKKIINSAFKRKKLHPNYSKAYLIMKPYVASNRDSF